MTPTPILILLAATLGGCATASSRALPVCDGQHRRPANPYGSVLDPKPAAAPATAAAPSRKPTTPASPPAASPPACGL